MSKRLTKPNNTYYGYEKANKHIANLMLIGKLGQYEDLEEKSQINYRKVLQCKHGTKVYVFYGGKIYECVIDDLTFDYFLTNLIPETHCQFKLFFNEYGTYWALTREELTKGSE